MQPSASNKSGPGDSDSSVQPVAKDHPASRAIPDLSRPRTNCEPEYHHQGHTSTNCADRPGWPNVDTPAVPALLQGGGVPAQAHQRSATWPMLVHPVHVVRLSIVVRPSTLHQIAPS